MVKMKLIKILSQVIQEICEMEEEQFDMKEGKIKFRQYQREKLNESKLRAIDVTVEM